MIPFTDHPATRRGELMAEIEAATVEIARSTADLCRHKFRRGDLVNELIAIGEVESVLGVAERLTGIDPDGRDLVAVLYMERRCSAHIPEFARLPQNMSWSAHYELCALSRLDQVMEVQRLAIALGDTSKRGVRALVAEVMGHSPVVADPSLDWPDFYRDALRQHFGGRLGADLIDEIVTQQTRFRREWERAHGKEAAA